ncbi:hypothetical protein U9M48_030379 [Paspalum notatum var. saurae]|uniref:Transposase n=2 Tax=Paspalum notatum var. saurae TaxID=547442 RepID=A0AAQ3U1A8_PASNO
MYISTAVQRGWPLGMLVQSIPRGIVSSEGVENYGNTSVAMAEDIGFEHGQQNEDGHTDLGVAVVGHGASGTADDEEGNGRQHEVEEQAYEGRGSQAEPQGLADEGERIPSIVQQMQNEDDEFAQAQEIGEGSDEDEDYPIPGEWREYGFGNPVVHDAKQQEWEYRENEVVQGAKYASSALLKDAVKLWSLSLKKEFKVVKSTQSVYDVCCVSEGCPWRLHAYKGIMKTHWKVSIITEHTCYNREVPKYNRNLTAALVANEMYGRILDAPHFEPKQIIREMELQHQYTISYAKAYRAKQKVFEMRFGTYEDSYDNLPRMLATIAQRNPGTYYDVMHFPNPEGGKYKGTILTAIGVDGNNQVLPVAFAFVENENVDSWYWFLERVKTNVVSSRSNVCLISDRHSGILDAIEKLKHGNGASPPLWPDVHSRWCMRHLAANFYDHFKNKDLQDLFKSLCSQNQQRKFNAIWKLLDELTAKHQTATSSASSSARTAKPFSQWIQDKPKEKWALLYDTNGRRYGIMTTNHAECYNMVMRSSRGLPLVGVVEFILYGCAKYFRERYMSISADLSNASVLFGRTITKYMETKTDKAQIHNARLLGTRENRLSRLGQPCSGTWVAKVEPYVQAWDNAHQDVVHPVAPHTDWWYETFLTWYRPRTRCHVTYADTQPVPHESSSTDAYARHRDEALAGAMQICCQLQSNTNDALQRVRGGNPFTPDEQLQRLTAANESLVSMMHAWGYSIPLQGPPPHQPPIPPQYTAPSCSYMPPMDPASTSYAPMHPSPQHVTPMDPPSMSYTPMGTSLQPQSSMPYQPMGLATSMSFTPIRPQTTGFNLFEGVQDHQLNFSDLEHDQHDIIGASQLEGAPLFPTQEATQTPVEQIRPHRVHRSPDPLTYSVGHVHAQQRPKRGRSRRDG